MYAEVVIDIKNKEVDRAFTYRIPENMNGKLAVGSAVCVPFGRGNHLRTGYVTGFVSDPSVSADRIKEIDSIPEKAANVDDNLLKLAIWMRYRYGGSLYQAISTVIPNKMHVEARKLREYVFSGSDEELDHAIDSARKKKHYAKLRLLEAFVEQKILPADIVRDRLHITAATVKAFMDQGFVSVRDKESRSIASGLSFFSDASQITLNEEQNRAVANILSDLRTGHVLYGITGSGKTEVYLKLIEETLKTGKEAIVLIPEIALTYQNVMRFYNCFHEQVSVVHSRLSKGEKWERFERSRNGEVRVMIGPRSALFTPFQHLGLIIVDEFHETSYLSDQVPKFSTVDVAFKRAENENAKLILGSATPSVDVYQKAINGTYGLHKLKNRAVPGAMLPEVEVIDLREELRQKNRSIFSRSLQQKIRERLVRNEQVMLFLNRRGYSGSVSCRSCGKAVECPHCSVPLNYHQNGILKCHFCGYETRMIKKCPSCGSEMIGTFGIGTQRVEEMVHESFPDARTLRMDADTTAGKDGHRKILELFVNHEADILIGTQMIVKGHDFPKVTLVGILAADLSLNVPDYRSAERTFQLLTQAEGRAGRGQAKGECIVQTYFPEHYAVDAAAKQDYERFFETEMLFRTAMHYPPHGLFAGVRFMGQDLPSLKAGTKRIAESCRQRFENENISFLGPVEESAFKVKDQYRYVLHIKCRTEEELIAVKQHIESFADHFFAGGKIYITFEN